MSYYVSDYVRKYFGYLITELGFHGPYVYHPGPEDHAYLIKDRVIVDLYFCGAWDCYIFKLKKYCRELETGEISLRDIDRNSYRVYDLALLYNKDPRIFYLAFPNDNDRLQKYSELIRNNPEILGGDFRKFSPWHNFIAKLKAALFK